MSKRKKPESKSEEPEYLMMKPGETARMYCGSCSLEFEITFEPKAKGDPGGAKGIADAQVYHCPFCGEESLEFD